jgi:hypothetical protein
MPQSLVPILISLIGVAGTLSAAIITQLVHLRMERERRQAEERRVWNQELFRSCKDLVSVMTEIEILCSGLYYNPKEESGAEYQYEPDMKIQERILKVSSLVAEISLLADPNLAKMARVLLEWTYVAMDKTEHPERHVNLEAKEDIRYMREHFQCMFQDALVNDGRTSIEPSNMPYPEPC